MKISINSLAVLAGTLFLASVQTLVKCEANCDDNSKLQYEVGKSYVYKLNMATYDSEEKRMMTNISPSSPYRDSPNFPQTSGKIETQGRIVLTALQNCDYVLTLSQVIQEVAVKRYTGNVPYTSVQIDVPRTSVKFTFRNGEVSGLQTSPNEGEPWTQNILRGILTMIQNKAMSNADGEPEEREINIKGDCIAHVKIPKEGTYRKHIQMGQCSEGMVSPSADGVPYTNPIYSTVSTHHHARSFLVCHQIVEGGFLHAVNCTEQDDLPVIRVRMDTLSTLQLVTNETAQEPETVGGATTQEISILTQHTTINYDTSANILGEGHNFYESIAELAKTMYSDPDVNKAELFLRLKDMMASIKDFAELENSLAQAVGEEDTLQTQFVKNIIRKGATEVGTEAAVIHLANLANNNGGKELEWGTMLAFYSNLPYSRHPTLNGLRALLGNLEEAWSNYQNDTFISFHFGEKKKIRKIMLGTSAYAYQFCKHHPDCGEVIEYQALVNQISQFCNSKQPEISPACAHALGNVEHLPATAVENVKNILLSSPELLTGPYKKITAFEAFRRDPCQPELKTLARENLENTQNTKEMRIVAYLAVARCSQESDLPVIDKILETEFDTPLSSFIATHVYNIMDSQSPSKMYLKSTPLGQIGIPDNVPKVHNSPTSSRFLEYSTFRPEKNVGFSADAYVIFKDDGTETPLFAHANVTVDFLGKSYNKFQVGLSKRYFPRIEKFNAFLKHTKARWIGRSMIPAFFGVDSFYRLFGTTVSMGIDIFDTLRQNEFFDKSMNNDTGLLSLDFVTPFTLVDKEIIFPTVAGLPISFSAQAAYLPIMSMNHTGDPHGLGFFDLFSKWDEKSGQFRHNSTSDSTLFAQVSIAAGKGTPNSMAYNFEAKMHCNHSIGYESMKNLSTNWVKKIEFPHKTIWSDHVSIATTFSTTSYGRQNTHWPVFGNMEERIPRQLFRFEHMGLRFIGDVLKVDNEGPLNVDIILKVEKTEDQFAGYILDIESKEQDGHFKSIDVALKANGLSTVDTLQFNFGLDTVSANALQNDEDRPKSEYTIGSEYTRVGAPASGFSFKYFSEGFPKTDLNLRSFLSELEVSSMLSFISLGLLTRSSYRLELDTKDQNNQMRLIDWSIDNTKKDNAQITMKFGGPLEYSVGTIAGQVSTPDAWQSNEIDASEPRKEPGLTVNAEVTHNSRYHGDNKVTVDFSNVHHNIHLNTSANIHGQTYHLTQHMPKDEIKSNPTFLYKRYEAHYEDSLKRDLDLTIKFDKQYQETFYHLNGSLLMTGSQLPAPLTAKLDIHKKHGPATLFYDEMEAYSWLLEADVCGKRTGHLLYTINRNETPAYNEDNSVRFCNGRIVQNEDGDRCSTHKTHISSKVSEMYNVHFNFSNETPLITKLDLSAHRYHPNSGGVLHVIVERDENKPALLIKKTTNVTLKHHEDVWRHSAVTDIDQEKRTLALNSQTSKNSQMNWTLNMDVNWPEMISNGDVAVKLVHTCPERKTLTLDILNQASTSEIFNNTLTAVWDVVGRSREFTPKKQLIWMLVTDDRLAPEQVDKQEKPSKMTNELIVQTLAGDGTTPSSEIFRMKDDVQIFKLVGQDIWTIEEVGNAALMGKEKAYWNGHADLDISEHPGGDNAEAMTTVSMFCALPRSKLNINTDGWFETESPEVRNNTWISHYSNKFDSKREIRWTEDYEFLFQKKDEPSGEPMFTVNVNGTKDVKFKDILHFSHYEKANIIVDNKTTIFIKDIIVNGPHITIYMKHDGPGTTEAANNTINNGNEDSWLIDFAGGIYQEKHQHKFNLRNSGSKTLAHHGSHHHHHHHKDTTGTDFMPPHHRPRGGLGLFRKNFNFTISK